MKTLSFMMPVQYVMAMLEKWKVTMSLARGRNVSSQGVLYMPIVWSTPSTLCSVAFVSGSKLGQTSVHFIL